MMKPVLTHTELSERVLQIGDSAGNACTLVLGEERALLFDTMTGALDLRSYIEKLTDLPLTTVISHGHFDHVCGAWQFGEAWIHPKERAVYEESLSLLAEIEANTGTPLPEDLKNGNYQLTFRDLSEGQIFDLGGIRAEAVALPGHTAGSMGLLIREERLLLVGDAVSPQMCLFFPVSLPIETYLATLDRVETLPADRLAGSHFMKAFPMEAVEVFRRCALHAGKGRGMRYSFPPVPMYRGTLWMYEMRDSLTDEIICIILPRTEADIQKERERRERRRKKEETN